MGFNKNKGISTAAAMIVLAIFNIIVFLLPIPRGLRFWVGYGFTTLAFALFLIVILFLFHAEDLERTFLKMPLLNVGWTYFLLQIAAGIWQITSSSDPYLPALIIDSVLACLFIIIVLAVQTAVPAIDAQEQYVIEKVVFFDNIQNILLNIYAEDETVMKKVSDLRESFRYSDPMSHSDLLPLEKEIEARVQALHNEVSEPKMALVSIENINRMLIDRNNKCKILKTKRDEKVQEDKSGMKPVAIVFGVFAVMSVIALTITSIVIPSNAYKAATELFENGQYMEAHEIFVQLNGFKNSETKAEDCIIAVKEESYVQAKYLMAEKCYDEAIALFTELGDYKDSCDMIPAIYEAIKEDTYILAGEYAEDEQKYLDAIRLYAELGNYKDSEQKTEELLSRIASRNTLFYGTYKENPIEWYILKVDPQKLVLIAKHPICELPYHDVLENTTWEESSLRSWLNTEFLASFTAEQIDSLLPSEEDGQSKVFLLSYDEAAEIYRSILNTGSDWWLRSGDGSKASYVNSLGYLTRNGDLSIRAKGVRPCIWIDLT